MSSQSPLRPVLRMAIGLAVAVQATPLMPAYAGGYSKIGQSTYGTSGAPATNCGGSTGGIGYVPPPVSINKNITIYKPITLNNNVEINKNLVINKPVTVENNVWVNKPITIEKNIEIYKPITIENNIDNSKNINIEKNVNIEKNIDLSKNITINKTIEINKGTGGKGSGNQNQNQHQDQNQHQSQNQTATGGNATATGGNSSSTSSATGGGGGSATTGPINITVNTSSQGGGGGTTNNSAVAQAAAAAFVNAHLGNSLFPRTGGGSADVFTGFQYQGGNIGQLNIESAPVEHAERACVQQWATVVKAVHAVCLDRSGQQHPAVRMRPETWIDSSLSSEVFRCLEGSWLHVTVGDMVQSSEGLTGIYSSGQTLECHAGEALRHFKDGLVKCAAKEPVPDCTERTNLRRWGSGDLFFSYVTKVCVHTASEESTTYSSSSSSYSSRESGWSPAPSDREWSGARDSSEMYQRSYEQSQAYGGGYTR